MRKTLRRSSGITTASGETLHARNRKDLRILAKQITQRQAAARKHTGSYASVLRPFAEGEPDASLHSPSDVAALERLKAKALATRPWYMIEPEGVFRTVWDTVAVLLIFLLVLFAPILIAYLDETSCNYFSVSKVSLKPVTDVYASVGWQIFPIFTNSFFAVDIVLNMFTGVALDDGSVEYNLKLVWRRYFTSWFWIDIVACFPLECVLTSAAPSVNWYNTGKLIRLVRVVGITRRSRGGPFRWVDRISERRQEFGHSARRLVAAGAAIFVAVHYFACLLFWVIRLQDYPAGTWPVSLHLLGHGVPEQYLWSIFNVVSAMIGLGYGSVPPATWPEALVWVFAMVTVAIMFAVLNGFILALIISSASSRHRYKDKMDVILDTVRSRNLDPEMRQRIVAYFKYRYREGRVEETDPVLRELPYDMQAAVALQSSGRFLRNFSLIAEDESLLERTALLLSPAYALGGEEILREGWPARHMYFIRKGYVDILSDGEVINTLHAGEYFGEAALLRLPDDAVLKQEVGCTQAETSHYAEYFTSALTARALTNCDLFVLDSDEFLQLLHLYPGVRQQLRETAVRHAKQLHSHLRQLHTVLAMGQPSAAYPDLPAKHAAELRHRHSLAAGTNYLAPFWPGAASMDRTRMARGADDTAQVRLQMDHIQRSVSARPAIGRQTWRAGDGPPDDGPGPPTSQRSSADVQDSPG